MGRGQYEMEHELDLYQSNLNLFKARFSQCIYIKAKLGWSLDPSDLLSCVLLRLAFFSLEDCKGWNLDEPLHKEDLLTSSKILAYQNWAELRFEDWLKKEGRIIIKKTMHGFAQGSVQFIMHEKKWVECTDAVLKWLTNRWQDEIAKGPWKSENELFQLIKNKFRGYKVEQHARPVWLSPQHLDVFIPKLNLAIEYQGKQHYEPVSIFGGEEGFISTVERDKRKAKICQNAGVHLEYVKYSEDTGVRTKEIVKKYR